MKTEETERLEKSLYYSTKKMGLFGCFEVTIGFGGRERVDYLTYDTNGTWRCYEIKVSKKDFNSKAKTTFVGHYNYYVMPHALYDEVKDLIPPGIGVVAGGQVVKRANHRNLAVPEEVLMASMIRSLYREVEKVQFSPTGQQIALLKRKLANSVSSEKDMRNKLTKLQNLLCKKFGHRDWENTIKKLPDYNEEED